MPSKVRKEKPNSSLVLHWNLLCLKYDYRRRPLVAWYCLSIQFLAKISTLRFNHASSTLGVCMEFDTATTSPPLLPLLLLVHVSHAVARYAADYYYFSIYVTLLPRCTHSHMNVMVTMKKNG